MLVECLERIDRLEPKIHAWVTIDREGALKDAGRDDLAGPLQGMPVGIKDIFDTRGLRTSCGSTIFKDRIPKMDAAVVLKLREAGAIILGKTATTEFAVFDPGPTRNPWNPEHTPGGSSSGSAAAVAAEMCPIALGSQTLGSVGRPAAYCGVIGFVPTAQRISREGMFPAAPSLDHVGIFARSVENATRVYQALTDQPIASREAPAAVRIGVAREYFYEHADSEMQGAFDATVDTLSKAGALVTELSLPEIFTAAMRAVATIFAKEISETHRQLYSDHHASYGKKLRALIESGRAIETGAYRDALDMRSLYQEAMLRLFGECDVVVTPGATGAAPKGLESTGDPVMNAPWTFADFPTLTLPVGLSPHGLPLAIQLTAAPLNESTLLAAGAWCEKQCDRLSLFHMK